MPKNYQTKINFDQKKEAVQETFSFDGGWVTDEHETKLQVNQTPNIKNVLYNSNKSIKTRGGYLRYNGDVVGSSSDESNTGTSTGTITLDAASDWVAQTFEVGTDASIVQVDFYLEMDTAGQTQYVQAELWSGSTGPSAELVDAQILLVSGDSETEYSFRFRVPQALTASTEYAVVLKPVIVRTTAQSISTVLVHHTGNDYANGAAYSSTNSGVSWSAVASTDLKFNVYTGGATGGTGLIRFYGDGGVQQSFAKFGSTYYRGNDSTGAMTAITMGNSITPASAGVVDYTVSNGTLLVADGSNYILKYRGSTNAAYTTGTISVTDGSSTVTGSGTSWNTTTNAEVGEYIQLPDTKWYRITAIANNTSLTIETTYGGSSASGQSYVISPWGVVQGRFKDSNGDSEAVSGLVRPTPKYIENHINRIWTLEGNSLRFSCLDTSISGEHFNDWDTANNAGQIIIPSGDGDTGTGLYSLGNRLFVFQRRAIWGLYGNSPGNFELRNITNEVGMITRGTLVEYDDVVIFQSDLGIYMFDGTNLRNLSEGVVSSFIATWANKTSCVATLWDDKYVLCYTESGSTLNDGIIFLDLVRGLWGRITGVHASAWMTWAGGTDDGRLYFASSNQGSIYRWDVGGHDDGYKIETLYDTPSIGFDAGINDKALKRFYLQQLALGDWNMEVTMFTNIQEVETAGTPISLSPGTVSLWDEAMWDEDVWSGEGSLITTRVSEFQGQGEYQKFRFYQMGYDEGVEILGMNTTARVRRLS